MFKKFYEWFVKQEEGIQMTVIGIGIIVVIIVVIFFFSSIKFVSAGQSGIKFNKFTGKVSMGLNQGINFVNPLTTKVKIYDLKTVKSEYKGVEGLSSDSQTIKMDITINWKLQPDKLDQIYQKVFGNLEDTIMLNAVYDTAKAELGKYQIDDIAKNREKLRDSIEKALSKRLGENYIFVSNVSIVDVDFSEDYEKAINAKMIAEQEALEAKNLKEKARYESEAKAIENKNLSQTITPLVLKQKWIEKWDGKLPSVMTGANSGLILNLPNNQE